METKPAVLQTTSPKFKGILQIHLPEDFTIDQMIYNPDIHKYIIQVSHTSIPNIVTLIVSDKMADIAMSDDSYAKSAIDFMITQIEMAMNYPEPNYHESIDIRNGGVR